ncbi:hypothetical protein BO78DRAFT_373957 [Aspergillus sclerotiicarbonarius CBS 121057]|uniref:Uncharacterized protein n=1 Tax=Aspergillus sclerotiicarbonarius (strain CBS 121057 / IBT 28362) TaxID=1448318 RepID=A0A319EBP6_ASPSB|nr:hypothetical protein BO78DRAFT_373957 [Aspergillus sclerotiicarbonarius CBS 121057]
MPTLSLPTQIEDEEGWHASARAHGVPGVNLYRLASYKSASKIGKIQYLALRAVWKCEERALFDPQQWGLQGVESARKRLSQLPHWKAFLNAVPRPVPVDEILPVTGLGGFELIWYYGQLIRGAPSAPDHEGNGTFTPVSQRTRSQNKQPDNPDPFQPQTPGNAHHSDLTRLFFKMKHEGAEAPKPAVSPSNSCSPKTPEDDLNLDPTYEEEDDDEEDDEDTYPPVSDENVVNSYLAGFASLVTMSVLGVKAHWSQERRGFKVRNNDIKLYEARTDGHLFLPNIKGSSAIVEVKPMMRWDSNRVMMQETAEMAAWIHAEPDDIQGQANDKRFLRLLLSMNRHEIYLIIAEYNVDYVKYLTNPYYKSSCQSFLTMNQFGPWDIGKREDVEDIGSLILAVTWQFSRGLPLTRPSPSVKKR